MGQAVLIAPGTLLCERYEIEHLIAAGGMAEVYAATDRRLERLVAVKVVRTVDMDVGKRLSRESVILARLDHPNIVRVFDADEHEQMPFLVMEMVEGVSLAQMLADGPIEPDTVRSMASALADALVHAHELGIVHRDIKPSNVLIEASGRPRLADFGIARATDATSVTATGVALGSAAYVAPEQLGEGTASAAADIYSTGLVLLECLTGRREFAGSPTEAALARLQRDPEVPADLDPPWPSLLEAMTQSDPDERPTAAEVAAALDDDGEDTTDASDATTALDIQTVDPPNAIGAQDATVPLEAAGGTTVMPVPTPPPAPDATEVPEEPSPRRDEPTGPARPRRRVGPLVVALLLGLLVVAVVVVATSLGGDGGDPPPPVADEGLVRALDRLEQAASVQPRFAERVANIREAVFVSDAQTAITQLEALGAAAERQADSGGLAASEAEAIRNTIIDVQYELTTLPSD